MLVLVLSRKTSTNHAKTNSLSMLSRTISCCEVDIIVEVTALTLRNDFMLNASRATLNIQIAHSCDKMDEGLLIARVQRQRFWHSSFCSLKRIVQCSCLRLLQLQRAIVETTPPPSLSLVRLIYPRVATSGDEISSASWLFLTYAAPPLLAGAVK
jgi:hypothetical protein